MSILNENLNVKNSIKQDIVLDTGNSGISRAKLPSISIQIFTGEYSEYAPFIENFKSVIHNNKSLDNVQKLYYLRSFLHEQPYELIKNLPLVSESYENAMILLDKRYYNKYKIANEHINSLLNLERLSKFPSANEIRNFVSVVRQTLSALPKHGSTGESLGSHSAGHTGA